MSAQARDDAFHASLAGPLGRSAMTLAGTAFFVILVNTLVEALGGFVGGAPTTIRAATLVLLAACAATFWREEAPTRAFAFAAIVLGVLMANICGLALLLSQTRSDAWGAMYLLLVLPAILSWRPRALGCLSAVLLAPAIATSLTGGDSLPEASTRSMILAGTALFGYLIARTNYHARRREFDAALELQEANHSLRAAHVHLVQADKLSALGTLSACIAHELAQPLTLMMGYTGVLASKLATGVPNEAELANQVCSIQPSNGSGEESEETNSSDSPLRTNPHLDRTRAEAVLWGATPA